MNLKFFNKNLLIVVLVVLLVGSLIFIGCDKYAQRQESLREVVFQEGVKVGYQQAVFDLVEQASSCEVVPLRIDNESLGVVAVDCLQ